MLLHPSSLLRTTALAAALVLSACSKTAPSAEPVRAVKLLTVGAEAEQAAPAFAAEVRARVESGLGFRVAGKLLRRPAELGQRVRAGQVLAELDPQDYRLAAAAAQTQVVAARTSRDLAAADLKRYQILLAQNFISTAELERHDSALKAAQAQLEQAQSQAAVQGNQAGYATLQASADGVVTAVEAQPGQVLAAGATVLRLAHDGARDVVFSVPEDRVGAIRMGSAVVVQLWAQSEHLSGTVREVAASADPVTRTFLVKVALQTDQPPALGSTATAWPEMLAPSATKTVIKLPTSALRQDAGVTSVWVFEPDSMALHAQPVQVERIDGNSVVLSSGLVPGQQVVATGVHVLSQGQRVRIYQAPSTATEPAAAAPPPQSPATPTLSAPPTSPPAGAK